jgi:DNA-binding transcriptional regulator YiaG
MYSLACEAILELEHKRDGDLSFTKENKEDLELLNQIWDLCRKSPSFLELQLTEDGNLDFSFVDSEWIKKMIEFFGVSKSQLAEGVNVGPSQISSWLSGERNPSGPAQAAIFYYFKSLI